MLNSADQSDIIHRRAGIGTTVKGRARWLTGLEFLAKIAQERLSSSLHVQRADHRPTQQSGESETQRLRIAGRSAWVCSATSRSPDQITDGR